MKIAFLLLFACSVLSVTAQKEKTKEKFVKIDMPEMPIAEFPDNSIHISGIQLIQKVNDSVRMGYAYKGMDNSVATLMFKKPLTEILQKQVNRMYKHEYKKDGATIFWVIKDLRFGAKSAAADHRITPAIGVSDYSYTRFNADAYISPDGSLFKKVCTVDTVLVVLNMGGGHGPDLENALRVLLKKTLLTAQEVLEQNVKGLNAEQISESASQKPVMSILTDSVYNEGAYASYAEFLANNPSIKNYETVVDKKKKVKLVSTSGNSDIPVWGICKNGEIYKYHQESLIPIEKEGTGFVISGYVENTTRRNNNKFNIGLAAGMLGGVFMDKGIFITVIFVSGKPLLVNSIPYIDDPKEQPLATCIDMRTGNFSF